MFCFGLSRTFAGLVLRCAILALLSRGRRISVTAIGHHLHSRCITGALNGNIGVMKSMLGELTDSTNMAQGFALLPMAWSVGMTLGLVDDSVLFVCISVDRPQSSDRRDTCTTAG